MACWKFFYDKDFKCFVQKFQSWLNQRGKDPAEKFLQSVKQKRQKFPWRSSLVVFSATIQHFIGLQNTKILKNAKEWSTWTVRMITRKLKSPNAKGTKAFLNRDSLKCQKFKFKTLVNSWLLREETINIRWNYWMEVIAVLTMSSWWTIIWNVSQIPSNFPDF